MGTRVNAIIFLIIKNTVNKIIIEDEFYFFVFHFNIEQGIIFIFNFLFLSESLINFYS